MVTKRMSREEFFAELSPLDSERLRQVLWNLYWRGSEPLRERIEEELDPAQQRSGWRAAAGPAQFQPAYDRRRRCAGRRDAAVYRRVGPLCLAA